MQNFINNIVGFVNSIFGAIANALAPNGEAYNNFIYQSVFTTNSLIGVNITWYQLFKFLSVWILVILFIFLFVKFVLKLVSIFRV